MLEALMFRPVPGTASSTITNFFFVIEQLGSSSVRCMYNSFDARGGGAYLVIAEGIALHYGAVASRNVSMADSLHTEQQSRRFIKASLPREITSLIRPKQLSASGWTFAWWSATLESPWLPVWNQQGSSSDHPRLGCRSALYGTVAAAARWVVTQYEREGVELHIRAILRGEPISVEIAHALMPTFDWSLAATMAASLAWPLECGK